MARIMRSQVQSLRQQEFVQAAVSVGPSPAAIIRKHAMPNALGPIIVYTTLTIPSVMLLEACQSFLGLGIQPGDLVGSAYQLRRRNHGGISMAANLPGLRPDAHPILA